MSTKPPMPPSATRSPIRVDAIIGDSRATARPSMTNSPFVTTRTPIPPTAALTASPFPLRGGTNPPLAPFATATANGEPAEIATVMPDHARSPAIIRATAGAVKWAALLALFLGGYFVVMKQWVFPTLRELQQPSTQAFTPGADAPVPAKVLRQTRAVVAGHDANIALVNEIAAGIDTPAPAPAAPVPVRPVAVKSARATATAQAFLDRLRVSAVYQGFPPRALIDDRLVQYGELVDWGLGIKFIGIDTRQRLVSFRDINGATLTKPY